MPENYIVLSGGGKRLTKQKIVILNYLRSTACHPTAEKIYQEARKKLPRVSLGTVYRNLNFLVNQGLALKIHTADDRDHFDGNIGIHAHFICGRCKTIHDICIDKPFNFKIINKIGRADLIECNIYGICRRCKK